jgi:hypothetical protein
MSKKTAKKTVNPLGPKPAAKRSDAGDGVITEELEVQAEQFSATAVPRGNGPLPAVPTALEELPPAAAPKPLTPLAALWPDAAPPKRESKTTLPPSPVQERSLAAAVSGSAPPKAPTQAALLKAPPATTPAPTAATTCNVRFELMEPTAKRVALCGEFNQWSTDAAPLTQGPDGRWTTTIALAPGRYEYKFFVDGNWMPDPAARENAWNYHGTLNSVIEVRA